MKRGYRGTRKMRKAAKSIYCYQSCGGFHLIFFNRQNAMIAFNKAGYGEMPF